MAEDRKVHQKGRDAAQDAPTCPACGAVARRRDARFCSTCGRALEEQYNPSDALRASYHLHRAASAPRRVRPQHPASKKRPMSGMLPRVNRNGASATALAFTTYALVPFLGILFVPGALLIGAVGFIYSYRAPHKGGRRAAFASIIFGLIILGVQLFLWWVIINVPEWTNPGGY